MVRGEGGASIQSGRCFSLRRDFRAPRHRENASVLLLRVESEKEREIKAQDCERSRRTEYYSTVLATNCRRKERVFS